MFSSDYGCLPTTELGSMLHRVIVDDKYSYKIAQNEIIERLIDEFDASDQLSYDLLESFIGMM
jgi:hypothetical protein